MTQITATKLPYAAKQIQSVCEPATEFSGPIAYVMAFCEDASIWIRQISEIQSHNASSPWVQIEPGRKRYIDDVGYPA